MFLDLKALKYLEVLNLSGKYIKNYSLRHFLSRMEHLTVAGNRFLNGISSDAQKLSTTTTFDCRPFVVNCCTSVNSLDAL